MLNKGSFLQWAGVLLIGCRFSVVPAQLAETETRSGNRLSTDAPIHLQCVLLLILLSPGCNDLYIKARFQAGWRSQFGLLSWLPEGVFMLHVLEGGLHIHCIIVAPRGHPRPPQACPPSCFTSVCSYMGIFLPPARLHFVCFLNTQLCLPLSHHTYTHSYSCWYVGRGRRGSSLSRK